MKRRLEKLEEYRKANGLKHADIARMIGANSLQSYNNWRYRGSLPKEYFDTVDRLLMADSQIDQEILERLGQLTDSQKAAALLHLKALLGD